MASATIKVVASTVHHFVHHRVFTKKFMVSPEPTEVSWQPDKSLKAVQVNLELGGQFGQATFHREIGRYREPGSTEELDDQGRIPVVLPKELLDHFIRVIGYEVDTNNITHPRLIFEGVVTDESDDDREHVQIFRALDYRYVLDEIWCLRARYHREAWHSVKGNVDPPVLGRFPSFNIRREDGKLVGNRSHDGWVTAAASGEQTYVPAADRTYRFGATTPAGDAVSVFAGLNDSFQAGDPAETYGPKLWSAYDVLRYLFLMHVPRYTLVPFKLYIPADMVTPLQKLVLLWAFQGKRLRQCLDEIFSPLGLSYTVMPVLGSEIESADVVEVRVAPVSLSPDSVRIEDPDSPGDPEKEIIVPGNRNQYNIPVGNRTINVVWTRSSLGRFDGVLAQGGRIKVSLASVRRDPQVSGGEKSILAEGFTQKQMDDFLEAVAQGEAGREKYRDVYAVYVLDPETLIVFAPDPAEDDQHDNVPVYIDRDHGPDWDRDNHYKEKGAGIHRTQHLLPGYREPVTSGIRGYIDYEPRTGVEGVEDDYVDEDTEASSNADEGDADSERVAGPARPFLILRKDGDAWLVEQTLKPSLLPDRLGFRLGESPINRALHGPDFVNIYGVMLAFECDDYVEAWRGTNVFDDLVAPDRWPSGPERRRGWSRVSLIKIASALHHEASRVWPPVYDCVAGQRKAVFGTFRSDWNRLAVAARYAHMRSGVVRKATGTSSLFLTDLTPGMIIKRADKTTGEPVYTVSYAMLAGTTTFRTGAPIGK